MIAPPPHTPERTTKAVASWYERRRTRELALVACFLLPALTIFFLYRILPLAWNLWLSFHTWSPLRPAKWVGLENYQEMLFEDDVFWQALTNTLIFIGASPVAIALALMIALVVNSDLKGAGVYRTIVFLSYPLMTVAVGIIWRWLYDEKVGLINYILLGLHLTQRRIAFLDSYEWAMPSVVVAAVWQIVGFYMVILLAGLQNIPPNLQEAAALDGAAAGQRFRHITLPLLRPAIFLCLMVGVINSFTSFDLIYVMTGGGPNYATEVLITYIYRVAFVLSRFDYAAALTIVLFVFLLIVTAVANRLTGGEAGAVDAAE